MNYWLMKSEPSVFGIDHLAKAKGKKASWDGVRNFQARNYLKEMRKGDHAFLYHSSCDVPGIAGTMVVSKEAYPDATAFDRKHDHYDPDSDPKNPRWFMVDVTLDEKFARIVTLEELRAQRELKDMIILRRGNRLSVTPVTKAEWDSIVALL
jgi:predicted RNA-binding protein with PUA-like domain